MKDQVSGSFLERRITLERCHASAEEEHAFAVFAEMQLEMDLGKTRGTGQLFKTSLENTEKPQSILHKCDLTVTLDWMAMEMEEKVTFDRM